MHTELGDGEWRELDRGSFSGVITGDRFIAEDRRDVAVGRWMDGQFLPAGVQEEVRAEDDVGDDDGRGYRPRPGVRGGLLRIHNGGRDPGAFVDKTADC